jgi:hypothetical protein
MVSNSSAEFFQAIYWAVNLDLGQNSSQNIFLNSNLLAESTDIFHDNVFINFTFQNTPLSDGRIPGNGYRSVENISAPLTQTPATLNVHYQCWRRVGKPGLLALIDVLVPTLVLFALLIFLFYFVYKAWHGRNKPRNFRLHTQTNMKPQRGNSFWFHEIPLRRTIHGGHEYGLSRSLTPSRPKVNILSHVPSKNTNNQSAPQVPR